MVEQILKSIPPEINIKFNNYACYTIISCTFIGAVVYMHHDKLEHENPKNN